MRNELYIIAARIEATLLSHDEGERAAVLEGALDMLTGREHEAYSDRRLSEDEIRVVRQMIAVLA